MERKRYAWLVLLERLGVECIGWKWQSEPVTGTANGHPRRDNGHQYNERYPERYDHINRRTKCYGRGIQVGFDDSIRKHIKYFRIIQHGHIFSDVERARAEYDLSFSGIRD